MNTADGSVHVGCGSPAEFSRHKEGSAVEHLYEARLVSDFLWVGAMTLLHARKYLLRQQTREITGVDDAIYQLRVSYQIVKQASKQVRFIETNMKEGA
jgi:hypothetical protein